MISIRPIKDRDEWLGWRDEVLTASDVAAIAGVDPYKTAYRVYVEKMTHEASEESPIMRRGRMFEHAAYSYLQEDHPHWEWIRPQAFYADVDLKLGATPDALAKSHDRGLINVQIKTVSAPVFESWNDEPPIGYVMQTVTENMLTQADEGILAVMVVSTFGAEMHEYAVPRHEGAERKIGALARDFWHNVKAGLLPPPDYRMDSETIAKLHPPRPEVPVPLDLSGDNRLLAVLGERELLKKAVKEAEETISALDAEIVHKLDGATLATIDGWKITNKTQHRNGFYVEPKSFPVLRATRVDTVGTIQ